MPEKHGVAPARPAATVMLLRTPPAGGQRPAVAWKCC